MQTISLDFDIQKIKDIEQLIVVLGYVRAKNFNVEINEPGVLPEEVRVYVEQLQDQNALEPNGEVNQDTIVVINNLLMNKKYQDPTYVAILHQWLIALSYFISEEESNESVYGETTTDAVKEAQLSAALSGTGQMDAETEQSIEAAYNALSTGNTGGEDTGGENTGVESNGENQVLGTVLNTAWQGIEGTGVKLFEKLLRNGEQLLGETNTDSDGRYEINYSSPIDSSTGSPKKTFHLTVKVYDLEGTEIDSRTFFKASNSIEANFTAGNWGYQGMSVFEKNKGLLEQSLGEGLLLSNIEESGENQDVTFLHADTGMVKDEIMKLVLAHRIAAALTAYEHINAAVIYAFLHQNSPQNLPSYLLPVNLNYWNEWIGQLVPELTKGIIFTNPVVQQNILNKATTANILPIDSLLNLEGIFDNLRAVRLTYSLNQAVVENKIALKDVLNLTSISEDLYPSISSVFSERLSIDEGFWQAVQGLEGVDEVQLEEFKMANRYAKITNYHTPAMQVLNANIQPLPPKGKAIDPSLVYRLSDYAKWSQEEWNNFVETSGMALPESIYVENTVEKQAIYAGLLYEEVQTQFPDVALLAEIGRNTAHELQQVNEIAAFLDAQPDYDLKTTHVDVFVKANPDILSTEAVEELKVLKRLSAIVPNSKVGTALLKHQIYSAKDVYAMGESQVVQTLTSEGISAGSASQVFNAATSQYANALALASTYGFNQQGPKAIINLTEAVHTDGNPVNALVSGLPDLETLFGALDYCECQHCKSVYSPAAYFTDLMRFIGGKPANSGTVKDVLLARRPDLDDIKLNCENAHKPMPYIDLVCEVLENGVRALSTNQTNENFAHNTTLSTEELKALPEYLRLDAYKKLAQHAPMNNHFNLWLAEAHLFLAHLGVPYHQLMKTWQISNTPDEVSIAAAYFEIYTNEKNWILTSLASNPQPLSDIWDQIQNDQMPVPQFLDRSKLSYDELIELLQLEFLNPSNALTVINRPIDSCAIEDQILEGNLSDDKMDKIHRFIRLWRNTDWKMWELDLLIRNSRVGNGLINGDCLVNLQKFHELQQDLALTVEELLAFYENLDTTTRRDAANKEIVPFYSRLFLNPAIDHPNIAKFSVSAITNSPNAIFQEDSYSVAAAIGTNETVVFGLLPISGGPSASTGIETLSGVYRYVTLAQRMGISVATLVKLIGLLNIGNPFVSLDRTRKLLEAKAILDQTNLSVNVLEYLIKRTDSLLEINEAEIIEYLSKQRVAKNELKDDLFNTSEPPKDVLKRHLAKIKTLSKQSILDKAIQLIFVEDAWNPVTPVPSLPGNFPVALPVFSTFVNAHFNFVRDINDALTILDPDATNTNTLNDKIDYVLGELEYYLTRLLIQVEVTANLELSEDVVNLLLNLTNSGGTKLITVLRDETLDITSTTIDAVNYPEAFETYRLLHKMSLLVDHWELDALELDAFVQHYSNNNLEILRLHTLPIQQINPPTLLPELLIQLFNWYQFIELNRRYTVEGSLSIQHIWSHQTKADLLFDLSKWMGVDYALLDEITGASVLNLSWTDFYSIETYKKIETCLAQQQRLGVQISRIKEWTYRDGTVGMTIPNAIFVYQEGISNQIKKAAKSKYSKEAWLDIRQPIQDVLRLQKRDALIQHFLEYDYTFGQSWNNSNDLFQYYLIDVAMSACQITSRLKQAISSVQLFVQRCLMNLETPEVVVANPDADVDNNWNQWKWMQNYRIWEANRKVFLYPENWIEPELRDDKSPFFKELENDLLQKEITHDNVTEAFGRYLQKVDQVAHMDVMGMCNGIGPNGESLKHVLGRTKEIPGNYFFRTFNNDGKTWTAWEAVDVDIKGEHAIPFVYNNKVHIFWLEILERPSEMKMLPASKDATTPSTAPANTPVLEIQLAWTVQKKEGWSPKTISSKKLIHPWPRPDFSLHLRPRYRAQQKELWMDLFVSTSREFNDKEFYDQYTGNFSRLAVSNFSETTRPWHSSSFIFDGRVQSVKLLGLMGDYYLLDGVGANTNTTNAIIEIISVTSNFIETNYGAFAFTGTPSLGLANLNNIIQNTSPHAPIVITSVSNGRINTQNYGAFPTNDPTTLNNLIQYGVVAPLQVDSLEVVNILILINPSVLVANTNYGLFYVSAPMSQLNALNTRIDETKGAAFPIKINWVGQWQNPNLIVLHVNNIGHFTENTLEALNNLITTGNPTKSGSSMVSSVSLNPNQLDSYTYVNKGFGADGRKIERLGNPVGDLVLNDGMHYEFNHWKNNEDNSNQLKIPFWFGHATLLFAAKAPFRVVYPMERTFDLPFFYQDEKRAFFVRWLGFSLDKGFTFFPFYHPYTDTFISQLGKGGMDALLTRDLQLNPTSYYDNGYQFSDYQPNQVTNPATTGKDIVDFSLDGAYAGYNWEVFFHIPLLIATNLSKNQRFEEAMQWFHYIFNPTNTESNVGGSVPQQYWITKPFYEFESADYQANSIHTILNNIDTYRDQVVEWKNNPFQPHLIARYRPVAYQRNVVMKYIDNLIAWGDQLFRRETLESINQATMLYVLAHELLGDRPVELAAIPVTDKTYNELDVAGIDYFGNSEVLVAAEGLITTSNTGNTGSLSTPLPIFTTQYFCIPFNEKLAGYWDLVEDRLFKIRHCMNIEGVVRQLPLFAPPIDPALLVNATAAGVDLGSVLDNLSAPRSNYKFRTLNSKAVQFCSEVKSLGQSLLSALQASDSEGMALLQSANAIGLLESITSLKELQIEEYKENIKSIELSRVSAVVRKNFYTNREFMNQEEALALVLSKSSIDSDIASTVLSTIASITSYIPDFAAGVSGVASPVAITHFGGTQISKALTIGSDIISRIGNILQKESGLVNQKGNYKRRQEEWDLQAELATKEIEQIDQQIAASKIRLAIAERDLDSHQLQIVQRETEEAYLKSKYTNKELYSWMSTQVSTIYFQAYQLAFDMAKRAENSFRYELAVPQSATPYIKFGYWDSLKKGLLSGDKLMLAIHKMEAAYLEQNKRMYELTKQISLRKLAPAQLLELKLKGTCSLEIPEWWFDMDYPGHYLRRIKSMAVSIPCIVGPHTNVNCTITLEQNKVRNTTQITGSYDAVDNYTVDYGAIESIATSHGQNDSGLFELNFNDERYLPFEGAGVISRWTLSLPEMEQFDYSTISDIVLTLRYCAKEGGAILKQEALDRTKEILDDLNNNNQPTVLMSLKQEFGTAWHRFVNPLAGNSTHQLDFELRAQHYPFFTKFGANRAITACSLYVLTKDGSIQTYNMAVQQPTGNVVNIPNGTTDTKTLVTLNTGLNDGLGLWSLILNTSPITASDIEDIILTIEYKVDLT